MDIFNETVEFIVYIVAFVVFVIMNPYITNGRTMDDISEFSHIKAFYETYIEGKLFNSIVQYSIIYWVTRESLGSLIMVVLINVIQVLLAEKETVIDYKETKKTLPHKLMQLSGYDDHVIRTEEDAKKMLKVANE